MASGIGPEGDALKKALQWLSDRRRDEPDAPRNKLIEEAGNRFDLTPIEVQFLYDNWK
jgi:hypothetical protein